MRLLFLHGWHSVIGVVKPTYLKDHAHDVINPTLDAGEFEAAVATAQAEFDKHKPRIVEGRGRRYKHQLWRCLPRVALSCIESLGNRQDGEIRNRSEADY